MAKPPATIFSCSKCDAQFPKWAGRCEVCGGWATISEEGTTTAVQTHAGKAKPGKSVAFSSLSSDDGSPRAATGLGWFDQLLSGGLTSGSVTLLGGEPGIGKSTALAQLGLELTRQGRSVVYVTGEESPSQVMLRLKRFVSAIPPSFLFLDLTQADVVASTILTEKPFLTIVDSIQTMRLPDVPGEAGNPTQVKASAAVISEAAKQSGSSVILVGQVNKDGDLAGPRLLEHLVDTVMMFEGDRSQTLRLVRVLKHRFGPADESAVLAMTERGLEEVKDPSVAFLADRPKGVAGSIVTCLAQGSRPLLVELQGLVAPAGYGTPTRRTTGFDTNRLGLLLAVLGRRCGVNFSEQDVFVNVVGGVDAREPSVDLALVLALVSAKLDIPIPADVVAWGEIGLSGEVRPVTRSEQRTKEAQRLGFKTVIAPSEGIKTIGDALTKLGLRGGSDSIRHPS